MQPPFPPPQPASARQEQTWECTILHMIIKKRTSSDICVKNSSFIFRQYLTLRNVSAWFDRHTAELMLKGHVISIIQSREKYK